ncbi:MAG: SpoVR family protein [Gemmataceae bacterium]
MSLIGTPYDTTLPQHLRSLQREIEAYARAYGLDFYEVIFEVLDADEINEIAAYGGFPTRYPHWSFGMAYEELRTGYEYGLSKIYEMVINNDPCYAYLMRSNNIVDQKLVMAHVYAHCDFFKNNLYFAHTNRKMIDEMAEHGARIRRYVEKYGEDEVEQFIDRCKSIEDLIDPHSVAIRRREVRPKGALEQERDDESVQPARLKAKSYMDEYINPPQLLKEEEEKRRRLKEETAKKFPERPEKDILLFLIEHAPLKGWQRDILSIIREEAYYFAPQAMTKIMNEGWASYWHSKIMTEKALQPSEVVDYCDHHSGTMASYGMRLNPYKLGIELFRDIEYRWNTGRFGKEWEECDDWEMRRTWDKKLGLGRQKIFEVRRLYNDVTFIDTFLTPDFCREHKYFSYVYQEQGNNFVIESREFEKIKQRLLFNLTNFGKPFIYVVDGNYRNRGELLLRHEYTGVELHLRQAQDTLANIHYIWSRPVHLQTVVKEKPTLLSYDGNEHSMKTLGDSDDPRRRSDK